MSKADQQHHRALQQQEHLYKRTNARDHKVHEGTEFFIDSLTTNNQHSGMGPNIEKKKKGLVEESEISDFPSKPFFLSMGPIHV